MKRTKRHFLSPLCTPQRLPAVRAIALPSTLSIPCSTSLPSTSRTTQPRHMTPTSKRPSPWPRTRTSSLLPTALWRHVAKSVLPSTGRFSPSTTPPWGCALYFGLLHVSLSLIASCCQYHLPACLRFLEASHLVEILRAAGPAGVHIQELSKLLDVEEGNLGSVYFLVDNRQVTHNTSLGHILRLLATHHITREVRPNVFANNRISAIMDSGRTFPQLRKA